MLDRHVRQWGMGEGKNEIFFAPPPPLSFLLPIIHPLFYDVSACSKNLACSAGYQPISWSMAAMLALSSCTGSQELLQKTQQCSTAKQRFIKKRVIWLFPLCTGTPGHNRHVARLHCRRRRRRRHAYAPTSNTASHDNHEQNPSWVSFSSLYGYGAPLGGLWAAGAPLKYYKENFFVSQNFNMSATIQTFW